MATQSDFLKLTKPQRGEFTDQWDIPMNDNSDKIDEFSKDVSDELVAARGSQPTLGERLDQSLDSDGNVTKYPEVEAARISPTNGSFETLKPRLDTTDWEVWKAREFSTDLRASISAHNAIAPKLILNGGKNGNGEPTWAGFTNDRVDISATPTPIDLMISGYRSRIRTDTDVTLSGGANTYYIIAQTNLDGVVVVDGDSGDGDPVDPEGVTSSDGSGKFTLFIDGTRDFSALDVQAGDILEVIDSQDAGNYIIEEVAPDGNNDQLKIKGVFPVGGFASINYNVRNPWAVDLSFSSTLPTEDDKMVICEAVFDGSVVTEVTPRMFLDYYVGDWRAVDVVGSPSFTESWVHALGTDQVSVSIQVSQANDGSAPVEELTLAELLNTLTVDVNNGTLDVNNTISDSDGTYNAGTGDGSVSDWGRITGDVTLTGSVAGSLLGSISPLNAVKMQSTRNRIDVKNLVSGLFYKDFGGVTRDTGFIRVIVRKRG
jgi:hypothetical protein